MTEGVVNLLKPPGMTSSDAVSEIRRIFKTKRVGHTGTLDPGASGVLPICIGRATRLFDFLVDKQKEYIAEICFGAATDTQDSYGAATAKSDDIVSEGSLRESLLHFKGDMTQIAPMYSAVRIDGKKLYELARAGAETIERERSINIDSMELVAQTGENRFLIKLACSRGTYVRTICHDIGARMGVPSHMSFLLRSRSGAFEIGGAYTLDELRSMAGNGALEEAVVPVDEALGNFPKLWLEGLSERDARLLMNGADIECGAAEGLQFVYLDGALIGMGAASNGMLHIRLNLMENLAEGGNKA